MKKIELILVFVVLLASCKKEDEKIKEVPDDLIQDVSFPTLVDSLKQKLPENMDILGVSPQLFNATVEKRIILIKESPVYVMFLSESAVLRNTLGWYSYDKANPPKTFDDFKWYLAFPNISGEQEGGSLKPGDMVQLGSQPFKAGTVIGFYLIVNGWKDGTIDYNNNIFFTDYYLSKNPSYQQHVLFKERTTSQIVLGFEDLGLFLPTDKDYNDIVIMVTDNKDGKVASSFDISQMLVK